MRLRKRISGYQAQHHSEQRQVVRAHAVVVQLRSKAKVYQHIKKSLKTLAFERDAATRQAERTNTTAETALLGMSEVNVQLRNDLRARTRHIRLLRQ